MHKSIRLNSTLRHEIAKSILKQYKENTPCPFNLEEEENRIGYAFWEAKYGKVLTKNVLDKYSKYFYKVSLIMIATDSSNFYKFALSKPLPTDFSDVWNPPPISIVSYAHPLLKEYEEIRDKIDDWKVEYNTFKNEVFSVIESVNTTKQLLEVWPEVEDFLPAHIADPSKGIKLPALQTSRLNEKLGIMNNES